MNRVPRAICTTRSHRLENMVEPIQASQNMPGEPVGGCGGLPVANAFQQQLSVASTQLNNAIHAREVLGDKQVQPSLRATESHPPMHDRPLVQPATQYAAPIVQMWQTPTHGWLAARQKAAADDSSIINRKKLGAETKIVQRQSVSAILWIKVSLYLQYVIDVMLLTPTLEWSRPH